MTRKNGHAYMIRGNQIEMPRAIVSNTKLSNVFRFNPFICVLKKMTRAKSVMVKVCLPEREKKS